MLRALTPTLFPPPGLALLHDLCRDARSRDPHRWARAASDGLRTGHRRIATAAEQRPGAVGSHGAQVNRGVRWLRQRATTASGTTLRPRPMGRARAWRSAPVARRCLGKARPGPAGWALPVARAGTCTTAASSRSSSSSAAWAAVARAAICSSVTCASIRMRAAAVRPTAGSSASSSTIPRHAPASSSSLKSSDQLLQLVEAGEKRCAIRTAVSAPGSRRGHGGLGDTAGALRGMVRS